MADKRSITAIVTAEPPMAHSATSRATRKALRLGDAAMKAIRRAPRQAAFRAHGLPPVPGGEEMHRTWAEFDLAVAEILQAPARAAFDASLQKAAGHVMAALSSGDREGFLRCEALYYVEKGLIGWRRPAPEQAMALRLLAEWAQLSAHMAMLGRFRDSRQDKPVAR